MLSETSEGTTTTSRGPIVWLVNEGGHDYTKLERFGRIMPLTTGSVNPFAMDRQALTMSHRLQMAEGFDYLAISGLQILNAVALALWLQKFPTANLLQWSNQRGEYSIVKIHRHVLDRLMNQPIKPAD